jgi:hypothetical protein
MAAVLDRVSAAYASAIADERARSAIRLNTPRLAALPAFVVLTIPSGSQVPAESVPSTFWRFTGRSRSLCERSSETARTRPRHPPGCCRSSTCP